MRQLPLPYCGPQGPQPLKSAYLAAVGSPRQAFYQLWIEKDDRIFRLCKASGSQGRVFHRQCWEFDSLAEAEALFEKRIREKTRPDRPGRRIYRLELLPAGPWSI